MNANIGTSTAILITFDTRWGCLLITNLGDSGFIHYRPNPSFDEDDENFFLSTEKVKLIYRSEIH